MWTGCTCITVTEYGVACRFDDTEGTGEPTSYEIDLSSARKGWFDGTEDAGASRRRSRWSELRKQLAWNVEHHLTRMSGRAGMFRQTQLVARRPQIRVLTYFPFIQ
jgi:hypothetical protein